MSLSDEQKQFYVDTIAAIWQGSMQNNNIENISESVADKIETILYEIQECSNAVKSLFGLYSPIYNDINPPDKWSLVFFVVSPAVTVHAWITFLLSKYKFKPCINQAALNWKNVIQMELEGI